MTDTPLLEWLATGEESELAVAGFARFRATYEGEGYYDDRSDGDPVEQDLYQIDILDASTAADEAWEADEDEQEPLEDLGLASNSFHLLLPTVATEDEEDEDEPLDEHRYIKQYLLVLAYRLYTAQPDRRERIVEEATHWTTELLEEAFDGLPPEWQVVDVEGERD